MVKSYDSTQPYDYAGFIKVPDPISTPVMQGVLDSLKREKEEKEIRDIDEKYNKRIAFENDASDVIDNPTPERIANLTLKYPEFSPGFSRANEILTEEKKNKEIKEFQPIFAAVISDNTEIADGLLSTLRDAYKNAGNESEANALESIRKTLSVDPNHAKVMVGSKLSASMGFENFLKTYTGIGAEKRREDLHPDNVQKGQAQADKAQAEADTARVNAAYAKITKEADIKYKEIQGKARLIEAGAKEISALRGKNKEGMDEAKLRLTTAMADKKELEVEKMLRENQAEIDGKRILMSNSINTADRILNTPDHIINNATGPVNARIPTLRQETADFEGLLNNLRAQTFLNQVPLMAKMGSLSDAEGRTLHDSLQNLNTPQSPEQLRKNVAEAQRLMLKGYRYFLKRWKLEDEIPDTPDLKVTKGEGMKLFKEFSK